MKNTTENYVEEVPLEARNETEKFTEGYELIGYEYNKANETIITLWMEIEKGEATFHIARTFRGAIHWHVSVDFQGDGLEAAKALYNIIRKRR